MENRNAPGLLSRALGLKKIDDLTQLIRDLVLEPSGVREDARTAVAEFEDLESVHRELCDVRDQCQALAALPAAWAQLQKSSEAVELLAADLQGLPVYVGEQSAILWGQRVDELDTLVARLREALADLREQEDRAQRTTEQRHADYLHAGGERIENVKAELRHARERLQQVTTRASDYQQLARKLNLADTLEKNLFLDNQQRREIALRDAEVAQKQTQDAFAEAGGKLSNLQADRDSLQGHITEIEARPNSNIDPAFQRLRDQMSDALEIPLEDLMFIGELIDVRDEHRDWQGAIERALGGLRTTLAVPEGHFSMVTRWLNTRHTGLHVRVQVVAGAAQGAANFKEDGFLRKLAWREHPYRDWLKRHLARFDLHCVADTRALDATPFSMTREGLAQLERGRFEKKDQQRIDDRRKWALGFSNKSRLALLRRDLEDLQAVLKEQHDTVNAARTAMDRADQYRRDWEQLATFDWDQIDVPEWQQQIATLDALLRELESDQGGLARAQARWEEAKQHQQDLRARVEQQQADLQDAERDSQRAQAERDKARAAAAQGLDDRVRERLQRRTGTIAPENLGHITELEDQQRVKLERERNRALEDKASSGRSATGIVAAFHTRWEAIACDWGTGLEATPDYLAHLEALEKEGLPALVDQFRERLNRHTTQSLAGIREKIESERDEIRERIDVINDVLRRTEFKAGSYLRLCARTDQYPHVRDFNQQLTRLFSLGGSDDHEARFAQLRGVIQVLDKASNPATAGTLESLRLLDPRHQMSFYAEELGREDGAVRDVLDSSSGKSGGEKEAFAGMIVAASLAYVLTPDGSDRPIYSSVFLDEAFSNTAEAVSRRVLRVFRELHIHVNLITPYKNLNLARESARSLLIAERDATCHESHLCEVTWEEIDRRLDASVQQALAAEGEIALESW